MPRLRLARLLLAAGSALGAPLAAQPLGVEFQVNTTTTLQQRLGTVASDPLGNFVVVWGSYLPATFSFGVFGQRFSSTGSPLGQEFRIGTYSSDQLGGSVASDAAGNFIVAWQDSGRDGSNYGVFAQRFTSAGVPAAPVFQVNTYTTSFQQRPAVTSTPAGAFVVAWDSEGEDGSAAGIFAQRYDSLGAPLGGEFRVNTFTPSFQRRPSVASDSAGNFAVVWESDGDDGSLVGVFAQRYLASGARLGVEFQVNTFASGNQNQPAVASDPVGNLVFVWSGQDGSVSGVVGQRYASSGAPLGTEFRVNTFTMFGQSVPSAAMSATGNFVIVWNSYLQDGSGYGVFGQRFGSSGAPLDVEFRVNTTTAYDESVDARAVASDSAGNFVVVWADSALDGSSFGVFAQRECVPLASVSISVAGATTVASCATGGIATVADQGGGPTTHQWGYRDAGAMIHLITGQTGRTYLINGADFASPAPPGVYNLFCFTTPAAGCGAFASSNEIPITVGSETTSPTVTPPAGATAAQTLCQ